MKGCRVIKFLFIFCSCYSLHSQSVDWLKSSTSTDVFTSHSFYTTTAYNDDFYLAGDFWKDLIIDEFDIAIAGESANGFIIKMDDSGNASGLWHFSSTDYVRINAMEVNPVTNSLIVTGYFRKDMTYNNEVWEAAYFSEGFVMSIAEDGSMDWIRRFISENESSFGGGDAIAIDESGNIFVGIEGGGELKIDEEIFYFNEETIGVIIAKFDDNGDLIDSDIWQSNNFEGSIDIDKIVVDKNDALVIGATVNGNIVIGDSTFTFSQSASTAFLMSQDNSLNFQWMKKYVSPRTHIRDIFIDDNDMIVSLQYNSSINIGGTMLVGSGSWGEIALFSLDENTEVNWVKNFRLVENEGIRGVYGNSITKWNDYYYFGGMYQGDVIHEGELILDNAEVNNLYQYPFIISLDEDGNVASVHDFEDASGIGLITGLSSNGSHLVFAGDYTGQITLEDKTINTINSALFYGALTNTMTNVDEVENVREAFTIYPTVVSDYLRINSSSEIESISLISTTGIKLHDYSNGITRIDVTNLLEGVYFVTCQINGKLVSKKFVKTY